MNPDAQGSELASWWTLWVLFGLFALAVIALATRGRPERHKVLLRVPNGIERLTGLPAWAGTTLGLSLFGLLVAGQGFYTDVAWHVALGRDDELFTAPHTAILLGLIIIFLAPIAGILVATLTEQPTALRVGVMRVPWSMVPLGVVGAAAVLGFPIDDLWHRTYGVDVTMWSPPHLVMIMGASLSGMASWLVLADAGVRPSGGWGRTLHVVCGALTLMGLSSVQGEFSFGVPQWQQLYHPVLACLAAGIALVAIRLVHGAGWAFGIAAGVFLFDLAGGIGEEGAVDTRAGAIYLGSALAVELAAIWPGTSDRRRFALASGVGVATLGLAVEWLWNAGAHQPWTTALLPDALIVGAVASLAAAALGSALGGVIANDRGMRSVPRAGIGLALVAVVAVMLVPGPRRVGDVAVDISLEWVDKEHAVVHATLEPPGAADDARWFTAGSWQWGGREIAHMRQIRPGTYVAERPILLAGKAKALLRLHRGAEMMTVPLRLPADPEYELAAVSPRDGRFRFVGEQRYLQREADPAAGWFAVFVLLLVTFLAAAWVGALLFSASRIARPRVPVGAT